MNVGYTILSAVVAVDVLVGVTLAYLEVRSLAEARRTDLVIMLYRDFGGKDYQEAS